MRVLTLLIAVLVACGRSSAPSGPDRPAPDRPLPPAAPPAVAEAPAPPGDAAPPPPVEPAPSAAQHEAWIARRPKSVIEAQLYRQTVALPFTLADGRRGTATLIDLAPTIGVWSTLTVTWEGDGTDTWHLENPSGVRQSLRLDPAFPQGLLLTRGGVDHPCDLWGDLPSTLQVARLSGQVYAAVCDNALAVRNPTVGKKTALEWTTDLLRDHVWGGEKITNLVKESFFEDAELRTAELGEKAADLAPAVAAAPLPALVDPSVVGRLLDPGDLGLPLDGTIAGDLAVGAWYPVHGMQGAWGSVMAPRYVDPAVITRLAPRTDPLDEVEAGAVVYTVAFDLSQFELGFEIGTDHPRVGWSERARPGVRAAGLPGPDGFDSVSPLVRSGKLDPAYLPRLVSVFVGGFKRDHGAFKWGVLSRGDGGSHFGFVEFGTVLSRLQPGLATVVVWADQRVELRTWSAADDVRLSEVRHARQNGVPVLETDPATGQAVAGALVTNWNAGNWSGSAEGKLRSVRGGLCLQESPAGRFLVYSYFSSATPSAMADVYAAYQCTYGMLLDMNALEHTYLAAYIAKDGDLAVRPLVRGMEVLDREKGSGVYPRFVGYADNRDFFYVLRKAGSP